MDLLGRLSHKVKIERWLSDGRECYRTDNKTRVGVVGVQVLDFTLTDTGRHRPAKCRDF